jgi:hypothetical protein
VAYYLLIGEGSSAHEREPIIATWDAKIVAAAARVVARRLGVDAPLLRRLDRASRGEGKPAPTLD